MTRLTALTFLTLSLLTAACGTERADTTPATHVDSVLPWDTALARFRADLPEVTALSGGEASLAALVNAFLVRLRRADTSGIHELGMTAAEFGWLYYPTVPEAHAPYDLSPGLMWFMIETNGRRGLAALLETFELDPPDLGDWHCDGPREYGENKVYDPCLFDVMQDADDTVRIRLFGPIVERNGRFKFVNFTTKL